jgi:hypothetical protein
MKIQCLIDQTNNNITIQGSHEAKRLIIDFVVVGEEGKRYDFKNLSFGYQLQKNNDHTIEESWPIQGIRFGKLSPGVITSADIKLEIDTDYRLLVWYTNGSERQSDVKIFNSGRPYKAYDSMVWNEKTEDWDMLKPYPENVYSLYTWNEEKLEWEIFELEKDDDED